MGTGRTSLIHMYKPYHQKTQKRRTTGPVAGVSKRRTATTCEGMLERRMMASTGVGISEAVAAPPVFVWDGDTGLEGWWLWGKIRELATTMKQGPPPPLKE